MRRRILFRLSVAAVIAATAFTVYWMRPEPLPYTDTLSVAELVRPTVPAKGIVFLFSDIGGYTNRDWVAARKLAASGALVVGIDLRKTLAKAESGEDCVYFISDIEKLSQLIQRSVGSEAYMDPMLAGAGGGGSMVLALAGQSPLQTIGRFIAVDPTGDLPLRRELCSGAPHHKTPDGKGWIYGMQAGALPGQVTVVETPGADQAGAAHVSELIAQGFAIDRKMATGEKTDALTAALETVLAQTAAPADNPLAGLPLAVLPSTARYDTMAIVVSGDGGWRDIDRQVGETLAQAGVPTVGIDSLRYFWTKRSPETIAADLAAIMKHYSKAWNVHRVVLIGYSFGADVLPAAYNKLPPDVKARVSLLSLLGLGRWATFEFDVTGWFGMEGDTSHPTLLDVTRIPPSIVQCIYGADDDDSVCDQLAGSGAELIRTAGDHHFDGDYVALANHIIARIR
ncbi:AcvB/VirJ family lysyl-phosphatidylglycerol hydrolase [Mesorhizobium sp. BAC0120]|uniref:virulence factor family protein n=1 Tax=Mesorhizobium sp. BAC0120 TaxID=3090670 RepID=UPI00298C7636|nr:AcvB/VirJ family lysyl-phosphatidylglycerol hydrolase [Mesorhizobium sp. BAC0120]MDW6020213.1 AcvB/VirJ family lysyl-phosphatidylglycerol hydrolase [Mesorhizobium sp. BAC0120]